MQDNITYHTLKSEILQLLPLNCKILRRTIVSHKYSIEELKQIKVALKNKVCSTKKDNYKDLSDQQLLPIFK